MSASLLAPSAPPASAARPAGPPPPADPLANGLSLGI